MRLRSLYAGHWQVLAEVDENGCCQVLDEIVALAADKKTKATAAGFRALWSQIPNLGPRGLGEDNYHRVDNENEINELIRRDHRLLCFEAAGRLIICSHVMRKKSSKTPAADKKKAASLRARYLADLAIDDVVVIE